MKLNGDSPETPSKLIAEILNRKENISKVDGQGGDNVESEAVITSSFTDGVDPPHNEETQESHPLTSPKLLRRPSHAKFIESEQVSSQNLQQMEEVMLKNQFAKRKIASQGLMDVALMMANISQLRTLITGGTGIDKYHVVLPLVCFSLTAQVCFDVALFVVYFREAEDTQREEFVKNRRRTDVESGTSSIIRAREERKFLRDKFILRLNFISLILAFIVMVTNIFITGFGVQFGDEKDADGVV